MAIPWCALTKFGWISSALRYCAIESSYRPIFRSSSAYESYGFGSSG